MLVELDCPWCSGPQLFEVPACSEGHGEDCPERVCTTCSGALLLASGPPPAAAGAPHLTVLAGGAGGRAA